MIPGLSWLPWAAPGSSWRSATRLNQIGTTTPWRRGQGQGGGAAVGQRKAASRMQKTFTATPGGPARASAAQAFSCRGGRQMKKNNSAAGDEDVINLFKQDDRRKKLWSGLQSRGTVSMQNS